MPQRRFHALHRPLAGADYWCSFEDEDAYTEAKHAASEALITSASRFAPDPRPFKIDRDAFTPRTIQKFTGHARGAVYGAQKKYLDGKTPIEDLFIIGTDQARPTRRQRRHAV